jgi:hypothetical protein
MGAEHINNAYIGEKGEVVDDKHIKYNDEIGVFARKQYEVTRNVNIALTKFTNETIMKYAAKVRRVNRRFTPIRLEKTLFLS